MAFSYFPDQFEALENLLSASLNKTNSILSGKVEINLDSVGKASIQLFLLEVQLNPSCFGEPLAFHASTSLNRRLFNFHPQASVRSV